MKRVATLLRAVMVLSVALNGCRPALPPTATAVPATLTPAPPTATAVPPIGTAALQLRILEVSSTADCGPGTFRQALLDARSGDTITFNADVFPPDSPASIALASDLPWLSEGHVTIDASDAGVILDGSLVGGEWTPGLAIDSGWNSIRGLQITNFTGAGIALYGNASHNVIGGDSRAGAGPLGQGNLIGRSAHGVALFGADSNAITGNLIGTDLLGTGPLPNRYSGIWLQDSARDNQIGPLNTLAFNGRPAIEVASPDSTGNTITQNSIHDNTGQGISLPGAGVGSVAAPIIFEFDLQAGHVTGWTCANCAVEIFSDKDDEGAIYEGQAIADGGGAFVFDKGDAFTNPHITLTATDSEGNTSEFSTATSGNSMSLALQEGNELRKVGIVSARFAELADNRIGDVFPLDRHPSPCPPAEEDWSLTHVADLGLKWVRLSLEPNELEPARSYDCYSQFEINECQDEIVTLLAENDITVLYTIVYWDETLHAENYPDYRNEEEVQRFLDYTRLIVRHFRGRIQYYEVLNEAVHFVELADYVNLIHRAVPVIREEDPEAKIVVGGATDLRHAHSLEYLFGVLRSDAMPLVDAVALHPMYGVSPQYDEIRQYYYGYPALVQEIRDMASANGFTGEYIAEEMCWRTTINPNPWEPWEYTQTVAAKYYARGIMMNLGMDLWAGIGGQMYDTIPPIVKVVRNLSTSMAGARPADLNVEIQSEATNIMSYAFSLPNGDMLLAQWTDGVALDEDPGMSATLTFPSYSAPKVVGIDVLNGFQQELIAEAENGRLVIRDLLVKDYPIILRLMGGRPLARCLRLQSPEARALGARAAGYG